MANDQALINGIGYSWADISLNLLGRTVESIKRISYGHNHQKQNNGGRGNKPTERTRGNKEPNASITISKKEFVALQNALATGQTLTDIKPFEIPIAYINDDNQKFVVVLHFCEFTGVASDMSQGDMELLVELPLIIGDITYIK